jgi:hypothetical protein
VEVSTDDATFPGRVTNIAPGGLGLQLPRETPPGTVLRLRAAGVTGGATWHEVHVCHCKRVGPGQYVVGCQFTRPPSWGTLRLFG